MDTLKRAIRYAVGRNRVEQALRKSEERFQLACRATSDGIWDWDIDTDDLWWNDTYDSAFGYQERRGRGSVAWTERIHPDERAAVVTDLASVVRSNRNLWTAEYRFLRTDGTYAHVLDRGYVLRDPQGIARRMIGAMTDITEHKQAENHRAAQLAVALALEESTSLTEAAPKILRAICDLKGWALGAMWLVNAHRTFLTCEAVWHTPFREMEQFAAFYRTQTFSSESGLAGTVWKLGHPSLMPNVLKDPVFPAQGEAERAGLRGAIAFPIREGKEINGVMEFFSREVIRPHTITLHMMSELGMKLDQFLEAHTLEQQLRQAQKMEALGRMAGGIAHDFNNLLTVINSWGELLLLRPSPMDERFRRGLMQIKEAGDRAAGLTRQLLSFTRHQVVEHQVLNLNDRVMDIVELMQRVIGEDINLVVNLDPLPGRIKADAGQIEQVVMNLVVNARDAMPHGGRLEIETARVRIDHPDTSLQDPLHPGPYVTLTVRDTGSGMNSETLVHIFEPFFTTKERGKGTGLGLATVYGIVQNSSGSISVESREGEGTAFTIYLPDVTEVHTASRPALPSSDTARGSELVLLVEDDDMVRSLAQAVLEANAYRVLPAGNAEDALRLAQTHDRIDLLMTDMVMPGMGGSQLANALRSLRPTMKILVTSGYDTNGADLHESLGAQASFLQKPYTPEMLTRKLREVLDSTMSVQGSGPQGVAGASPR